MTTTAMIKYKNITIFTTVCFGKLYISSTYIFKLNTNFAMSSVRIFFLLHMVRTRDYDLFGIYFCSQLKIMICVVFN